MTLHLYPRQQSSRLNGLVLAGLLAAAGGNALAQGSPPAAPGAAASGARSQHIGRHAPEKMQAMVTQHQADLKAKLKITPAQEGAWSSYTAAMQPPAGMGVHPYAQHADMDKLTSPERVDKMRALRAERMGQMNAEMDKRGNATKALYAALTPEQQKVFDAEHQRRSEHGNHRGHGAS